MLIQVVFHALIAEERVGISTLTTWRATSTPSLSGGTRMSSATTPRLGTFRRGDLEVWDEIKAGREEERRRPRPSPPFSSPSRPRLPALMLAEDRSLKQIEKKKLPARDGADGQRVPSQLARDGTGPRPSAGKLLLRAGRGLPATRGSIRRPRCAGNVTRVMNHVEAARQNAAPEARLPEADIAEREWLAALSGFPRGRSGATRLTRCATTAKRLRIIFRLAAAEQARARNR